jgi:hypothetical protein
MRLYISFCLLSSVCCYFRKTSYIKTSANIRNRISPPLASSIYDLFNATRDLIIKEVPNVKNIYWDDGEIVWEFRDNDDTNNNTTSVRVNIPSIDPVDSSSSERLLCI